MTYRIIDTQIWCDPWFEALDAQEKLLFIYLFTNASCNQAGVISQFSNRRVGFETGIESGKVGEILKKFSEASKVVIEGTKVACLAFMDHQVRNGNFAKSAIKALDQLPDGEIKATLTERALLKQTFKRNPEATDKQPESNPEATPPRVIVRERVKVKGTVKETKETKAASGKPATSDASKAKRSPGAMVDEDFLKALEADKTYAGIDIRREYGKMQFWLTTPRGAGKFPTKARFLNWLNRAEPTERKGNANGSTNPPPKPLNQIACPSGSTDRGMAAIERMRENVRKRAELREARRLQGEDHPTGGTGNGNALPGVPQAPAGERRSGSAGGDTRTGPTGPIHPSGNPEEVRRPDA